MAELRILTFVTDRLLYSEMRRSFEVGGFREPEVAYQIVDNTAGNVGDPYTVVNDVLDQLAERYLIVCHQDVRLEDGASHASLLAEIERADREYPNWAVLGPAGLAMDYQQVLAISDPWQIPKWLGPWPVEAEVLDELFLLIRPGGAELTSGLRGFHFYAADLCLSARRRGRVALVINFPLLHLSNGEGGRLSEAYREARDALQERVSRHYGFRVLVTSTGEAIVLSRYRWLRELADHNKVRERAKRWLGRRVVP